jgi:hypothetical protein
MTVHLYEPHVLHHATGNYFVDVAVRYTPKFLITSAGRRFRRLEQPSETGAVAFQEGKHTVYIYPKKRAPKGYFDQIKARLLQREILEHS